MMRGREQAAESTFTKEFERGIDTVAHPSEPDIHDNDVGLCCVGKRDRIFGRSRNPCDVEAGIVKRRFHVKRDHMIVLDDENLSMVCLLRSPSF
jgi:hypothetical protein